MATRTSRKNRTLLVFYLLVVYVIAQFGWWTYLIIDLNRERVEQNQIISNLEATQFEQPLQDEEALEAYYRKRVLMVMGEGSVFLVLLLLGAFYVRRSFLRERAVIRQQQNFMQAITHEFNTPLASIKLYLQTLQIRKVSPEKEQSILQNALSESERLKTLVDNLLMVTRMENSQNLFQREPLDFSQFLQDYSGKSLFAKLDSHQINWNISPGVDIEADRLALTSILNNLLENAVKYSPKGTTVTVNLKDESGAINLQVCDEGSGISESDRERIFDKFYRVGREETRKTKGTGLGLFIVKQIIEDHQGKIRVRANQPKGSIFEAIFHPWKPQTNP